MQPEQIAAWRMHNLRLVGAPAPDPVDVVRWLGAVQSQDFGPAKWSVASRTDGVTDGHMDELFNAGKILRTHVLRPTWHFVLPEDIRLLLQVTAPRVRATIRSRWRQLDLDDAVLARSADIVAAALGGGAHRTRRELGEILAGEGIELTGERLGHIMLHAELEGVVCSGALKGKQQTYALLDERAPAVAAVDDDTALAEMTRRYFTSHGPATIKDFQSWCSLTLAQIRRGLELVDDLRSSDIDGRTFWFAAGAPERPPVRPAAHLIQLYDEYVMGYRETRGVLDVAGAGRVPPTRPSYNGIVVLDTQVVGEWQPVMTKDRAVIRLRPWAGLTRRQEDDIGQAADRYGAFVGRSVDVRV